MNSPLASFPPLCFHSQMAGIWREAAERWLYLPELLVPALGMAKREEWVVGLQCAYSILGIAGRTAFLWGAYEVHTSLCLKF